MMNNKIVIVALVALSSMQFMPELQAEDMNYYQDYHWSKPFSREGDPLNLQNHPY